MATTQAAPPSTTAQESSTTIFLIAAFKLFKGLALLAVGFGALHLLNRNIADAIGLGWTFSASILTTG